MGTTEKTDAKDQTKAPRVETTWFVMDTTATHGNPRTHEQLIDGHPQPFTFEARKAVEMPAAIAIKFLRDPAFVRTDKDGKPMEYKRAPKQPEELGAGERLVLKEDETIARYDEMTTGSLLQRVVEIPGGEKFAKGNEKPERQDLIDFIVQAKLSIRKANRAGADIGRDEFVPEGDIEDEAA